MRTQQSPPVPKMEEGDIDPMSHAARRTRVGFCSRVKGDRRCTRAQGHDEGHDVRTNAGQHVHCDDESIVLEVW